MNTKTPTTDFDICRESVSTCGIKSNARIIGLRSAILFVEILFCLELGALLGWPIGWRLGAAWAALCEPVTPLTPEQVETWYYLPATFANYGLCIGAVSGAIWAYFHSRKSFKKQIIRLYQQGQTEPRLLAQSLLQTERNVQTTLRTLIQKGKIERPKETTNIQLSKHFFKENTTMKRVNLVCTMILMAFFLFGCLPSLHPIYTDDTVVFDEQLIGKWYGDGGTWSFTKSGEEQYKLRIIENDGKQATFEVHLTQLGKHRFIDLYPGKNMDLENTAEIYSCNIIPAHTFMKLNLSEPNLTLQWVCLKELIEDDPNILKHEQFEDSILITADSQEIQRVVLENLDEVIVDDEDIELKRCPDLFTAKEIVYDAELIGHWQETDGEYMDIIEWENQGYDILYSDGPEDVTKLKAIRYQHGHRTFLGLYVPPILEGPQKNDPLLTPDYLAEIQRDDSQLKVRFIDWSESEKVLDHQSSPTDNSQQPHCFFHRTSFEILQPAQ